mgnify:CR=1 FL=1
MGKRTDKGNALTRYLTGHTGIPFLKWDGITSSIDAPSPYEIEVTTARKLQLWHDLLRQEKPGVHIVIRYDNGMPSLEQAWVGMRLRDFAPLLQAHYESRRGTE